MAREDIKQLNVILSSKSKPESDSNSELVYWYRNSSQEAQNIARNRVFNALLDYGSDDPLIHELAAFMEKNINRETSILLIRYLIATDQLSKAKQFYIGLAVAKTRKRHAQLLISALTDAEQWNDAIQIYELMIQRYQVPGITGEDLVPFLLRNFKSEALISRVIDPILGQPLNWDTGHDIPIDNLTGSLFGTDWGHIPDPSDPQLLDFTDEQLRSLINNLDTAFKQKGQHIPKIDTERQYKYIIDGANVLYYAAKQAKRKSDVKITVDSYCRVTRMLKALMNQSSSSSSSSSSSILLVLHERHFNPKGSIKNRALREIQYWKSLKCVDICRTPRGCNDDYYSLINAFMRPSSMLVTNDLFRDHILNLSSKKHNLDLIAQWRQEKVIEYDMGPRHGPVLLKVPPAFSFRVQRVEDNYYIPMPIDSDALWLVIKA